MSRLPRNDDEGQSLLGSKNKSLGNGEVTLTWENLNFYVPKDKNVVTQKQYYQNAHWDAESAPSANNSQQNISQRSAADSNTKVTQVLKNCSGHANPGEMVAILGPSGAGKTSLLNLLAQRSSRSKGSSFTGDVKVNGKKLTRDDFGRYAVFVEQESILLATFTPRQLLTFAAKMRTNLTSVQISERVNNIIERLGLERCQNTIFGGNVLRGLSGGEKKRVSIGYELITNPKLILLDEPTSAVDSYTALTILELLQKEANNGCTIVFTIHQPSSDMYALFDRVICLSEGFTIYNGERQNMVSHFAKVGVEVPKFTNPADFLIRLAIFPDQFGDDVTLEKLNSAVIASYRVPDQSRNNVLNSSAEQLGSKRQVSFFKQFYLIAVRHLMYLIDNPMALLASVMVAIGSIVFHAALFEGRFADELSTTRYAQNQRILINWGGIIYYAVMESSMMPALVQIYQIPFYKPVHQREYASGLYSLSAYYWAIFLVTTIIMMAGPIITYLPVFYIYDPDNTSFNNTMRFVSMQMVMQIFGSACGFMFGAMFDTEHSAMIMFTNFYQINMVTSGVVQNLKDASWVLDAFSYSTPARYGIEQQFRNLLENNPSRQDALDYYRFDAGPSLTYTLPIAISFAYVLLGFFVQLWQAKYL